MKKTILIFMIFMAFLPLGAQQPPDALNLYRQGQFAQAVSVCLQELEDRPLSQSAGRMDSYTVLGWSYIRLGQYENALRYARQARTEVPSDVRIIEIEAEALYYTGQNIEALSRFEEYVSLDPSGERIGLVYYFMGEIFLRLAEYRHADIAFATALYYSPRTARWWVRLGYAREQITDFEGAGAAYSTALELQPSLEEARISLERVQQS